jgi:hypothetical protein
MNLPDRKPRTKARTRVQNVLNAAAAAASRRPSPITLHILPTMLKPFDEAPPRMCWGDYYREFIYKREWFPIHPEDM